MDLQPNKTDATIKPITNTRISASEWNQLVGSCMEFITAAGFTPDAEDNEQFLNAFKAIAASLELVGANTNLSNLTATGEGHFAKPDLSNATAVHIVETYHNGTEWYRVWSDGWCEQGGFIDRDDPRWVSNEIEITFAKDFVDTNYSVFANAKQQEYGYSVVAVSAYTTTGCKFASAEDTHATDDPFNWEAKGYIS